MAGFYRANVCSSLSYQSKFLKKKGFSKLKIIKKAKAGKYEVAKMIKTELDIFNMARVVMDTYKTKFEKETFFSFQKPKC